MNLVEGNTLFVDGSKFRANASIGQSMAPKQIKEEILKLEKYIDELVEESERIDINEKGGESLVKVKGKITRKEELVNRLKECLSKMEEEKSASINVIDPDASKSKSRQGTHAIHNVQCVTDEKHGLIVNAEAVKGSNDKNELLPQIEQATKNMGHKPSNVVTDAGYFYPSKSEEVPSNITVIMPSPRQAHEEKKHETKKEPNPFDKSNFTYDKERDEYTSSGGKQLKYESTDRKRPNRRIYKAKSSDCRVCSGYGISINSTTTENR